MAEITDIHLKPETPEQLAGYLRYLFGIEVKHRYGAGDFGWEIWLEYPFWRSGEKKHRTVGFRLKGENEKKEVKYFLTKLLPTIPAKLSVDIND